MAPRVRLCSRFAVRGLRARPRGTSAWAALGRSSDKALRKDSFATWRSVLQEADSALAMPAHYGSSRATHSSAHIASLCSYSDDPRTHLRLVFGVGSGGRLRKCVCVFVGGPSGGRPGAAQSQESEGRPELRSFMGAPGS